MEYVGTIFFLAVLLTFIGQIIEKIEGKNKKNPSTKSVPSSTNSTSSISHISTPSGNGCCPGAHWVTFRSAHSSKNDPFADKQRCSNCSKLRK